MLILGGVIESGGESHRWRVMRLDDRYVCSRDDAVFGTEDREEAARFLANDGSRSELAKAHRFLDAMSGDSGLAIYQIKRNIGPISD